MLPYVDCSFVNIINSEVCEPPAEVICCANGEGDYFELEESLCLESGGTEVASVFCEPPADEMICCGLEAGNQYILESECTDLGGSQAAPSECMVCCGYPGGGTGQDPAVFCLAGGGSIVDDSECEEPDEMVCCLTGEDASYTEQSTCDADAGTVVAITECQLCCKNPFGNGPEYAFPEDCDQEQPESVCGGGGGM